MSLKLKNSGEGEKKELLQDGEVVVEKKTVFAKYQDFKEKSQEKLFTVLKFVKGTKFFTTDTAGFEDFTTDLG